MKLNKKGTTDLRYNHMLKYDIFKMYLEKFCKRNELQPEEFFDFTKRRDQYTVAQRNLFFYICSERPMSSREIETYMAKAGFKINQSSIVRNIVNAKIRLMDDEDLAEVVKEIM